jgi:hypothetical protein
MSGEPDDLTAFTHALANVPPDPGQFDRDALLFAAGRAAGRRGGVWPVTAAVLATLSVTLCVALVTRPPTVVEVERIVSIPVEPDVPGTAPLPVQHDLLTVNKEPPSPSLAEMLRQRQRVLWDGVPPLPQSDWVSESPGPSSDDVPNLLSLRMNATHPDGGRFQ